MPALIDIKFSIPVSYSACFGTCFILLINDNIIDRCILLHYESIILCEVWELKKKSFGRNYYFLMWILSLKRNSSEWKCDS